LNQQNYPETQTQKGSLTEPSSKNGQMNGKTSKTINPKQQANNKEICLKKGFWVFVA